jgi:hypothetical protein
MRAAYKAQVKLLDLAFFMPAKIFLKILVVSVILSAPIPAGCNKNKSPP